MRSTLRTLKDNRRTIQRIEQEKSGSDDYKDTDFSDLFLTSKSVPINPEKITSIRSLDATSIAKINNLYAAIFHPNNQLATDTIMLVSSFNEIIQHWHCKGFENSLKLCKAASYPSHMRTESPHRIMDSDSVWMMDLFTRGVQYCTQVGDKNAYEILDTSIYEGLNRISNDDLNDLLLNLPANPGRAFIARYLSLLEEPKYSYIKENSRIRSMYLKAFSEVLCLPEPIRVTEIMQTEVFEHSLSRLIMDQSQGLLFHDELECSYYIRSFTPFVYAEELALRHLVGIDISIGPLREELTLHAEVVRFHTFLNTRPTPSVWYTRPNRFPPLNFNDNFNDVHEILSYSGNATLLKFVLENLLRLRRSSATKLKTASSFYIAGSFYDLIAEVEETYQSYL